MSPDIRITFELSQVQTPGRIQTQSIPPPPPGVGQLLVVNKGKDPDEKQENEPRSPSLMVFDLERGADPKQLPLTESPHEVLVSRNGETAFISNYEGRWNEATTALTRIDLMRRQEPSVTPLPDYRWAHGLEWLDDQEEQIAITCEQFLTSNSGSVLIFNTSTQQIEKAILVGQAGTHLVRRAPDNNSLLYVTNVDAGTFTVVDHTLSRVLATVPIGGGAEGMDISPDGEIWIAAKESESITVLCPHTLAVKQRMKAPGGPIRIKIRMDGTQAVVANWTTGDVALWDVERKEEMERIRFPFPAVRNGTPHFGKTSAPIGIDINEISNQVYVSNSHAHLITVIDFSSWKILGYYRAGDNPDALKWFSP
jgi:YVTN family beta-propeller protein